MAQLWFKNTYNLLNWVHRHSAKNIKCRKCYIMNTLNSVLQKHALKGAHMYIFLAFGLLISIKDKSHMSSFISFFFSNN